LSKGVPDIDGMQPGSVKAIHVVVANAEKARAMLLERGVQAGEIDEHP
jgi:hypothetical protein